MRYVKYEIRERNLASANDTIDKGCGKFHEWGRYDGDTVAIVEVDGGEIRLADPYEVAFFDNVEGMLRYKISENWLLLKHFHKFKTDYEDRNWVEKEMIRLTKEIASLEYQIKGSD